MYHSLYRMDASPQLVDVGRMLGSRGGRKGAHLPIIQSILSREALISQSPSETGFDYSCDVDVEYDQSDSEVIMIIVLNCMNLYLQFVSVCLCSQAINTLI
jgi:hypothetical protein